MAAIANWDTNPVLTVEHVTMRFGGLVAVGDLSFNVGRGDITALIGPNGAGKTTVFNCITGFYKPTEGRIAMRHGDGDHDTAIREATNRGQRHAVAGQAGAFLLERMPDYLISANAKVARTFQNIRLFGGMTALENLMVAQHNHLMVASHYTIGGILGLSGYRTANRRAVDKAKYWLETTGLIDRADDPAADLPYGDQRRLEIARAMCTDPHLLCLDEPAAGLNPKESGELNTLLQTIRRDHDTSILLIEHDMGVVMEISDHVVVLDYGQKISDGAPDHVKTDPAVIAAYLGVDDEEIDQVPEIAEDLDEMLPTRKTTSTTRPVSLATAPPANMTAAKRAAKPKATPKRAATAQGKAAAGKTATTKPATQKTAAASSPMTKPQGLAGARDGKPDDLKLISGIGPKIQSILHGLGIFHFDQIALWKQAEVAWVDDHLRFSGRITRDDWIGQAKVLAKGGETAFSKKKARGKGGRS